MTISIEIETFRYFFLLKFYAGCSILRQFIEIARITWKQILGINDNLFESIRLIVLPRPKWYFLVACGC